MLGLLLGAFQLMGVLLFTRLTPSTGPSGLLSLAFPEVSSSSNEQSKTSPWERLCSVGCRHKDLCPHPRLHQWDSPILAPVSIQGLQDWSLTRGSLQPQSSDTPWGESCAFYGYSKESGLAQNGLHSPFCSPSFSLLPSAVYVSSMRSRGNSKSWLCPLLMSFLLFQCHLPSFHPFPEQLN